MDLSQFNRKQMPYFLFDKDPDGGGGGGDDEDVPEDEEPENTEDEVTFTPAQQKLINKMINKTKDSVLEKARKEAEDKAQKEKDDAAEAALKEQGKFKELAEAAEKKATEEKVKADAAGAETNRLKLQRQFELAVAETGLEFVSPKAADDAFGHLDLEAVGDNYAGLPDEIERLTDEYSYYFGEKAVKVPDIDAVTKTKVNGKQVSQKDLRDKKKRSGRYSAI